MLEVKEVIEVKEVKEVKEVIEDMNIDFEKCGGLVPAIIQDANTRNVLMLGYMNKEALDKTLATKKVTF